MNEDRVQKYLKVIQKLLTAEKLFRARLECKNDEGALLLEALAQNRFIIAGLYLELALLGEDQESDIEKGIAAYTEGIVIFRRLGRETELVEIIQMLAQINFYYGEVLSGAFKTSNMYGDLDRAIQAYKDALNYYESQKNEDQIQLAKITTSLGKALLRRGIYTEAVPTLEKARELWQKQKELPELAVTLYELGKAYHHKGCLELSRLYFKDSIRLFRRLARPDKEARVLASLGNTELQMGRVEVAINHLNEAKAYYYKSGDNQAILEEIEHLLNSVETQSLNSAQIEYVNS